MISWISCTNTGKGLAGGSGDRAAFRVQGDRIDRRRRRRALGGATGPPWALRPLAHPIWGSLTLRAVMLGPLVSIPPAGAASPSARTRTACRRAAAGFTAACDTFWGAAARRCSPEAQPERATVACMLPAVLEGQMATPKVPMCSSIARWPGLSHERLMHGLHGKLGLGKRQMAARISLKHPDRDHSLPSSRDGLFVAPLTRSPSAPPPERMSDASPSAPQPEEVQDAPHEEASPGGRQ